MRSVGNTSGCSAKTSGRSWRWLSVRRNASRTARVVRARLPTCLRRRFHEPQVELVNRGGEVGLPLMRLVRIDGHTEAGNG
jgi:hypothetical protein